MRGGERTGALILLVKMDGSRLETNTTTCNSAMSARKKGGERLGVLTLHVKMDGLRLETDTITCSSAVSAC